jgi:hypothetical protein
MYTPKDFKKIIEMFPKIKPCYEKITHNKVSGMCMLIPYGVKCYIWFTKYQNENVCFVLELFNKKINRVYRVGLHYHSSLCNEMGTILYGTIFMNYDHKLKMISVENILFRNRPLTISFDEQIEMIYQLFKEGKIRSKKVMIGLPIMMNMEDIVKVDDYKVQYCQYQNGDISMKIPFKLFDKKQKNDNAVFRVIPLHNEIYKLFDGDKYIDVACIPNYETSMLINNAFHKKMNLDAYEESDDEGEIEQVKEVKMECSFHEKFQKWVPIKVV